MWACASPLEFLSHVRDRGAGRHVDEISLDGMRRSASTTAALLEFPSAMQVVVTTDNASADVLHVYPSFTRTVPLTIDSFPAATPLVVKQPFDIWNLRVSSDVASGVQFADYAPKLSDVETGRNGTLGHFFASVGAQRERSRALS